MRRPRSRANGEGTIYRRQDGRWEGQLTISVMGGRQRRKSVYGKTRAEARDKLLKLQARLAAGLPIPEKMLVAEWLEHWIAARVENRLAPKTVISYRHIVDAYLKPNWSLGRVRLAALNPDRVQQMLDDLADRGVRPPTVKYALDILRIALRAAQLADPIQRENPASIVRAPSFRRRKAQPFTAPEAQAFLGAVREDRLHALWALGLTAALRRGELLGLQWGDVQLGRRRILIARQLQRQKGKGLIAKAVKRERSEAPVILTALAVRALEAHRARSSEERLAAGPEWRGTDDPLAADAYVFISELGAALDPDATYRRFAALLKEAGLTATGCTTCGTQPRRCFMRSTSRQRWHVTSYGTPTSRPRWASTPRRTRISSSKRQMVSTSCWVERSVDGYFDCYPIEST